MDTKQKFFTTKTIVTLAMLTALGYGLSWLEFPIFPAAPFLKLDFSTFVTLFGGYMFGPLGAVVIEGVKQLLIWGTKSTTGGVGEIANFIMAVAFTAVPTVLYRFKKGRAWVSVGLVCGCVCQIAASLLCNRYINFPLFMGDKAAEYFSNLWVYVLAFNAIKSVSVSLLVFLLYKRLSFLLKRYVFKEKSKPEQRLTEEAEAEPEVKESKKADKVRKVISASEQRCKNCNSILDLSKENNGVVECEYCHSIFIVTPETSE